MTDHIEDDDSHESITVSVEVPEAEGYGGLLLKAMDRVRDYLPDVMIYRSESDEREGTQRLAGTGAPMLDRWVLGCAHSTISNTGTTISGTFTFWRVR